jgi:phospholipid/cholesterol/gamma-HCH transport system substrate-binding protein
MKRRDEVLVGIFTTLAVLITVFGAIWLVRGGLQSGYPLYSRFAWGASLKQGQPVWLVGVTVGYVDNVQLDPHGTLVVTYRIRKEYQVPRTARAQVVPNGFFGDQAISLTPSAPDTVSFAPGDTVPVAQGATGFQALTMRADTLTRSLDAILGSARTQFVDSGGMREMRRTVTNARQLLADLRTIADSQSRELQSTLAVLRSKMSAVDSLQVDSAVRSLHEASARLAEVSQSLGGTISRVDAILVKLDTGNGSASRLLNDPLLYENAHKLLADLDSVVLDFKANPRRYLKFSVF